MSIRRRSIHYVVLIEPPAGLLAKQILITMYSIDCYRLMRVRRYLVGHFVNFCAMDTTDHLYLSQIPGVSEELNFHENNQVVTLLVVTTESYIIFEPAVLKRLRFWMVM